MIEAYEATLADWPLIVLGALAALVLYAILVYQRGGEK